MIYNIIPCPAPRMTQSDKWKKRPCVVQYHAFKDAVRACNVVIPQDYEKIIFWIPMPDSWSRKKKALFSLAPHRNRPDIDNLCKALFDALHQEDGFIWRISAEKRWSYQGAIEIL